MNAGATTSVASGAAAGLVPSKTTVNGVFVNLAASAVAERRVKRLKKSVWASGHLHKLADKGHRPPVCWFVTLTYRPGVAWLPEQVKDAINAFRRFCKAACVPCRYTWVAELQSRGAVHYHLLAWLPHGVRMPHWDRPIRRRAAFWPHGMSNTQPALSGVGYLMKYLSKLGELTRFPKGLRLYGIGGLDQVGKSVRSWLNLPEWVKRTNGVGDVVRKKSGLVVSATGEILQPAYEVCRVPFGLVVRSLRELPDRFHDGPYSTVAMNPA